MRLLLLAAVLSLSACGKAPCDDPETAFTKGQEYIRVFLKSPATAVFPKMGGNSAFASKTTTEDGKCAFMVVSHVDSQNEFGALIRSEFSVVVAPGDDGKWMLVSLTDITGQSPPVVGN